MRRASSERSDWARTRAVEARSSDVPVPAFDAAAVAAGARQYDEMCVACHLAPGAIDRTLHEALYPRPPDFTKAKVPPARAFWSIKHGIKMSGMPAWGASHDDRTIWSIVAFLQRLPGMDEATYRELAGKAQDAAAPAGQPHSHEHHRH